MIFHCLHGSKPNKALKTRPCFKNGKLANSYRLALYVLVMLLLFSFSWGVDYLLSFAYLMTAMTATIEILFPCLVFAIVQNIISGSHTFALRPSSFISPFSVVQPTQIFGIFKKKKEKK